MKISTVAILVYIWWVTTVNGLWQSYSMICIALFLFTLQVYTLQKFPITWTLEFRIEAKSNLWKLASKRKTTRSWRHDGKYHLVLVWYIFTDLVFFSLFIVKARRWLAQINATVPSPSSPLAIASLKWRNDGETQQLRNLWDSIFYNDHSHYHK